MELNKSHAASAFFTFYLFTLLPLKKAIEFFTLRSSLFPYKGVSLFYLFTFLPFYFFTFTTPISLSRRSACPQRSMR